MNRFGNFLLVGFPFTRLSINCTRPSFQPPRLHQIHQYRKYPQWRSLNYIHIPSHQFFRMYKCYAKCFSNYHILIWFENHANLVRRKDDKIEEALHRLEDSVYILFPSLSHGLVCGSHTLHLLGNDCCQSQSWKHQSGPYQNQWCIGPSPQNLQRLKRIG